MEIFPSTLFISSNTDLIEIELEKYCNNLENILSLNNPDIFVINENSGWGIDQIRTIKSFLSQKPFSHSNKIVIIYHSHNLNTESQNALLKTLEEPGKDNFIFITTNKPSKLLPTIVSRCHTIKLSNIKPKNKSELIKISGDLSKDLLLSETIGKNKDEVKHILEEQLEILKEELIKNPTIETAKTIEKLIKSIQMINANVDAKSALDYYFLA